MIYFKCEDLGFFSDSKFRIFFGFSIFRILRFQKTLQNFAFENSLSKVRFRKFLFVNSPSKIHSAGNCL